MLCFNDDMPLPKHVRELLKQVSRSFYLTLRVLPASIRPQIGLAYLLARATDTIADTRLVPAERRLSALQEMRSAISDAADGRSARPPELGELAAAQAAPAGRGSSAERVLLECMEETLDVLRELLPEDRQRIRRLLRTITRGQETDLVRFGHATADKIVALESDAELDEYIYCVAGCVGEFWTRMCRAHLYPEAALDDASLSVSGVRYGKGLQLVNILRDLPLDLRQGRCYLPRIRVAENGLEPSDLLDSANLPRFRPLYDGYLTQAENHLAEGWFYTRTLPYGQFRVRLACAWPALIGVKTIALLRSGNILDDRQHIKVSRSEVRRQMLLSLILYPLPSLWARLFDLARK